MQATLPSEFLWALLAAAVFFGLGWFFSRLDIRHWRVETRHTPKAYFQGLRYLLGNEHDKAIDLFIEAIQNDPDTLELHFTLGMLLRRRGEYLRAVRVHQYLLARSDLTETDRQRARMALAQDYWHAGLLDHTESELLNLVGHSIDPQLRLQAVQLQLKIAERGREWRKAAEISYSLEELENSSYRKRRAHYLCEEVRDSGSQMPPWSMAQKRQHLEMAQSECPEAPRPWMELAAIAEDPREKVASLLKAWECAPQIAPLLSMHLVTALRACNRPEDSAISDLVAQKLESHYMTSRSIDVLGALVQMGVKKSPDAWLDHLQTKSSLWAATRALLGMQEAAAISPVATTDAPPAWGKSIDRAAEPLLRYRCAACSFETQGYFWHCLGCQSWDSYLFWRVEEL